MALPPSQMDIPTAIGDIKTGGTCRINGQFMTRPHQDLSSPHPADGLYSASVHPAPPSDPAATASRVLRPLTAEHANPEALVAMGIPTVY
jgi:hypothetical protein